MLRFLARRLLNYVILVFVATSLAYLLASVTLNPLARYLTGKQINLASAHATLRSYNIDPDTSLWSRYWHWLGRIVLHGDFGRSFPDSSEVTADMGRKMGVSLRLLFVGSILSVIFGVLIGVFSALRQYKPSDHVIAVVSFLLLSTPVFLLATIIKVGSITLHNDYSWFPNIPNANECPSTGSCGLSDRAAHLVLPTLVLVLSAGGAAFFARYQRSAMLDVLGSDFIRTAQAKGLSRRKAFYKHGLRTALIPMATFFAFQFGLLLVGAVFTERIFNWSGMGAWSIDTINNADINGIAAITGFAAVMILISGMLSDIFYAILDPRVRVG
ncbi:MAG: ABC transporter permease [Jatrophihabitans sp.]|uniref:ABC transporter permease n=1 Tax=Jatrophihabitans sp. TaxID=1932789 RepID=UPI003F801E41